MRMPGDNARGAGRTVYATISMEFAAYDTLPRAVKRALQESNIKWAAGHIAEHWKMLVAFRGRLAFADVDLMVNEIRMQEAEEAIAFSRQLEAKHGHPLPGLAAGVSILRGNYDR